MSREIMQQALTVLKAWDAVAWRTLDTIEGLEAALAQPEPQVCCGDYEKCMKACTPRGRWLAENELAQPEQTPVAWMQDSIELYVNDRPTSIYKIPLYTAPPKREWVGLTNDEIQTQWNNACLDTVENPGWNRHIRFAQAIEFKLKELNL